MKENDKKIYLKIRQILNDFNKNEYWDSFDQYNVFVLYFSEYPVYLTFRSEDMGRKKGIDLFLDQNQLEYFFDLINSTSINLPSYGAESFYRLELVDKNNLDDYDTCYLSMEAEVNIKNENNFIPYIFEAGYDKYIANEFYFLFIYKILSILNRVLKKDFSRIYEYFLENECVNLFVSLNSFRCGYITAGDLYPIFVNRRCKIYNKDIIRELKDTVKLDDDCYIIARYLPLINKDTDIRALLVIFIYNNKKVYITKYIKDSRDNYSEIFMGMLYDLLSENGIPARCYFDFRDFYYASFTTLKRLGVKAILDTIHDYTTEYFEEALEEIFNLANQEYLDENEMYNLLIEGASIFTAKLIDEISNGNEIINTDDELIDEDDKLDNEQTQ